MPSDTRLDLPLYGGGGLCMSGSIVLGFCVVERNGAYMANAIHLRALVRVDGEHHAHLCDLALWWDRYRTPPCFVGALVDARSFTGRVTVR